MDVVVEVQLVFDHPGRMVDAERRRLEATAIGRQEIESGRCVLAEVGEEIVPRRGRPEDRDARDMHGRLGRLHVAEERVDKGKTFHDEPPVARAAVLCAACSAFRQWPAISSTSSGPAPRAESGPSPARCAERASGIAGRGRHDRCQALDALRMIDGDDLGDHPAHRRPDDMGLGDLERVHEADRVPRHVVQRIGRPDRQGAIPFARRVVICRHLREACRSRA